MSDWKVGDRVVYAGPVINEAWDPALEGTVIETTGDPVRRISIRWDNGAFNYGHELGGFRRVSGTGESDV